MAKNKGRFFIRIPKETFLTPQGMVTFFVSCFVEILDPLLDFYHMKMPGKWEVIVFPIKLVLDFVVVLYRIVLLNTSIFGNLLLFLIERIPGLSTILPTWLLSMIL